MTKITKTYSVDQKIYEAFEQVADENNINKSSFIEGCINKYLNDNNKGYTGKIYVLKTNPMSVVSIRKQDDTFCYLNDGSKIPIILFMQAYKEVDASNFNEYNIMNIKPDNQFLKTGYDDSEKLNS
jgi:hypothetical protein